MTGNKTGNEAREAAKRLEEAFTAAVKNRIRDLGHQPPENFGWECDPVKWRPETSGGSWHSEYTGGLRVRDGKSRSWCVLKSEDDLKFGQWVDAARNAFVERKNESAARSDESRRRGEAYLRLAKSIPGADVVVPEWIAKYEKDNPEMIEHVAVPLPAGRIIKIGVGCSGQQLRVGIEVRDLSVEESAVVAEAVRKALDGAADGS